MDHDPLLVAIPGDDPAARSPLSPAGILRRPYRAVDGEPSSVDLYEGDAEALRELATGLPTQNGMALYDLISPEVFGSDDWVAAVDTRWTERLRHVFHRRIRTVYREVSAVAT